MTFTETCTHMRTHAHRYITHLGREREKERERQTDKEMERERETETEMCH